MRLFADSNKFTNWIESILYVEQTWSETYYLTEMEYCGRYIGFSFVIKKEISWEEIFCRQIAKIYVDNDGDIEKMNEIYEKIKLMNNFNEFILYVESIMKIDDLKCEIKFLLKDWL